MSGRDHEDGLNFCAAAGCTRAIAPLKLFCRLCWALIPLAQRRAMLDAAIANDAEGLRALKAEAVCWLGNRAP